MKFLIATVLTTLIVAMGCQASQNIGSPAEQGVNGKWEGTMQTNQGEQTATFEFKEENGKLTGTVGSPLGDAPLEESTIDGNSLSFVQKISYGGRDIVIAYNGTLKGNEIQLTRTAGRGVPVEFTVTRVAAASGSESSAWEEYNKLMEDLAKFGESVSNSPLYTDDLSQAEGLRMAAEFSRDILGGVLVDPDYPYFFIPGAHDRSIALPNPNSLYLGANIDGSVEHHMRCDRGSSADIIIQAISTSGLKSLASPEIKLNADHTFDLTLSPEEPACTASGCNWLNSEGTFVIFVRFTHNDWANERPGRCHIEKVSKEGVMSAKETTDIMKARFAWARSNLSRMLPTQAIRLKNTIPANTIWAPRPHEGIEGKYYSLGRFELEEGQALIIERMPTNIEGSSKASFSGIDLANDWFQSLEYTNRQSTMTTDQAYTWPGEDGIAGTADDRIRYVISKTDPGVKNWVDSVDRDAGWMTMRWQSADPAAMPPHSMKEAPIMQVVNIKDLPNILGADEFIAGPEERKAQIRARQIHMRERYTGWSDPQAK